MVLGSCYGSKRQETEDQQKIGDEVVAVQWVIDEGWQEEKIADIIVKIV